MSHARSVILTGASSGMGKIIAEVLALQGFRVFAGMRDVHGRNADNAAQLLSIDVPHQIVPVEIDVTDDYSVMRGVGSILGQTSDIDILINCAGLMSAGPVEAFSTDQFRLILETNVLGPFRLYKAVLPNMRARNSGLIITISSVSGRVIAPGLGIYNASKFAVEGLAESLGYEVSGLGIDTVIVQPGPFATNLGANQIGPADSLIVEEYGENGRLDKILGERLWPLLEASKISLDPRDVADLVLELIQMEPGRRPIRTTVGMDAGASRMNAFTEEVQMDYLRTIGFEGLARTQP
ncbi:SDR family NAD(P)-dependent oxidoreductase [Sphingobium sp. AN558]|uniref:SDR family NAD(P)-dependent oxidoreductase n=1 Tax=Sphingobium sp. AN558 TaxID=3133442 RepID=UPI0030BD3E3C